MTERVEQVLRDVQAAVAVRHLYAADHPRVLDVLARVVSGVEAVTAAREVSTYALDQRVVVEGVPLASSEALSRGLFTWLAQRGFHRLTFRHGLTADELSGFVAALAQVAKGADTLTPLASTPHLRLTALDLGEAEAPAAGACAPDDLVVPQAGESLGRLWGGVVERRTLEVEALDLTVLALAQAVEQHEGEALPLATLQGHDDYTVSHIVNVAMLAVAFAEVLGFEPAVVREIGVAALLHDVGRLRVPAEVLSAPGRLSDAQRALVWRHPEDGARMLMATPGVPELAVSVAFEHHMHYDGGGYPAVAPRWRVNLASEITHIADVFDALRSDRPYRPGLSPEKVAEVMLGDAGTVFSPSLLRIFFDTIAPRTPAH